MPESLMTLIEIDHANESPRVVFSTTDPRKVPDAACNWALDRMVRMASPVTVDFLTRLPVDLKPLLRLSVPNKKRSLFLCRQPLP